MTRLPRLFVVAGVLIAVVGLAVGIPLASEVRRSCADSDIYRLINLVCHHVHRSHPHLVLGLALLCGGVVVGGALIGAGVDLGRDREGQGRKR